MTIDPLRFLIKTILEIFFLFCFSYSLTAQEESIEFQAAFGEAGSSSRTAMIIAPALADYLDTDINLSFSHGRGAGLKSPPGSIIISTIGLTALLPSVMEDYIMNPLIDLRPITKITDTPDILVIRTDLGISTIDELISYSALNPGILKYFYIAPTSIHRLEFSAIFSVLGISATLDGSLASGNQDAMASFISGDLDLMISTAPYMLQLIDSGDAVPLAVIHPTRMPLYPNVPTLSELGVEFMTSGSWAGIYASQGTSDEQIELIYNAIKNVANNPKILSSISALGMEVNLSDSPQGFTSFLEDEMDRLAAAARAYHFRTN
jgi:tripartite-type tricarboxylate transporter receptor subunit TctC